MPTATNPRRLPGDATLGHPLAAALRVNHAGEYGATRIYAGQLAVLGRDPCAADLTHMAAQEAVHLAEFNHLLPAHGVRPTAFLPLWHVGGWLMGAASAALGPKAAMACTVAVETVITAHYNEQLARNVLPAALAPTIARFRDEEREHHDLALTQGAESTPLYAPLTAAIRGICRGAIWLSSRI
jgi:ubiquinone biosynthesis monooxygenase Coq7